MQGHHAQLCIKDMSPIITLLLAKMSKMNETIISGVLVIVGPSGLSSSWMLFRLLNNLAHLQTFFA